MTNRLQMCYIDDRACVWMLYYIVVLTYLCSVDDFKSRSIMFVLAERGKTTLFLVTLLCNAKRCDVVFVTEAVQK